MAFDGPVSGKHYLHRGSGLKPIKVRELDESLMNFKNGSEVVELVFAGLSLTGQPQISGFRHYGVENGLSQNTVWCVQQVLRGFIWVGTKDGLNQGKRIKNPIAV